MYKLLIVDDEDVEREGMADFIQWEKYGISLAGTAWNGVEGYEEIQNQMPDIVITDIKMPVMNGIELIRKTRRIFRILYSLCFPATESMSIPAEPWSWACATIY